MKPTLTEDVYGVEFLTTQILGRFSSLPAKEMLDPDPSVPHQTKDPDVNKIISDPEYRIYRIYRTNSNLFAGSV
jgi:hypothetical protein